MALTIQKRVTKEDDVDRLTERILLESSNNIVDKPSFNIAFNDYLAQTLSDKQDNNLRRKVFDRVKEKKKISKKPITKPKPAPKTKEQIKSDQFKRRLEEAPKFNATLINKKTGRKQRVFAIKVFVMVKGKKSLRYRDKKGRFVSIK